MDIELEGIDAVLQVRDDRRCMIDERDEQGREHAPLQGACPVLMVTWSQ